MTAKFKPRTQSCSPIHAAHIAKHEILKGNCNSAWEGINALVDWVHGPANRYDTCNPMASSRVWFDKWAGDYVTACEEETSGNSKTLDALPLKYGPIAPYLADCKADGQQAWSHLVRVPPETELKYDGSCSEWYSLSRWYYDRFFDACINGMFGAASPKGLLIFSRVKVHGCSELSKTFAALGGGANIPVLEGQTSLSGWSSAKGKLLSNNGTVRLPAQGYALVHGDDLWGPGSSLFHASKLWIPEDIALAATWKKLQFAEKGIKIGSSEGGEFDEEFNETWFAGELAKYYATRQYFEALLSNCEQSSYWDQWAEVLLDAMMFRSHEFADKLGTDYVDLKDGGVVFAAMESYMQLKNPLGPDGSDGESFGNDDIMEQLVRDDWGSDSAQWPARLVDEPVILDKMLSAFQAYGLDSLKTPGGGSFRAVKKVEYYALAKLLKFIFDSGK